MTGTVSPAGARVKVQGHVARVSGNEFTSSVKLAHGTNVIDVAATARGRATALTAFRVTRVERVAVPDFAGLSVGDAEAEAKKLDLKLESERGGGFLDSLVPRRIGVCDQEPAAGEKVRRGDDGPRARRALLLSSGARRDGDQRDARLAAVAHHAEHDPALDRVAAAALDAVAAGSHARRGRPAPQVVELVALGVLGAELRLVLPHHARAPARDPAREHALHARA